MAEILHGSARTTPRVRAELQASQEATCVLAARYGLNPKTVQKGTIRNLDFAPERRLKRVRTQPGPRNLRKIRPQNARAECRPPEQDDTSEMGWLKQVSTISYQGVGSSNTTTDRPDREEAPCPRDWNG
jgi:hypothetical protein